jgi:hypothetical protein
VKARKRTWANVRVTWVREGLEGLLNALVTALEVDATPCEQRHQTPLAECVERLRTPTSGPSPLQRAHLHDLRLHNRSVAPLATVDAGCEN